MTQRMAIPSFNSSSAASKRCAITCTRSLTLDSVALRFPDFMVSEKELRAAMLSMQVKNVNWTTTMDDRRVLDTIAFFVEPADEDGVYDFSCVHSLAH